MNRPRGRPRKVDVDVVRCQRCGEPAEPVLDDASEKLCAMCAEEIANDDDGEVEELEFGEDREPDFGSEEEE